MEVRKNVVNELNELAYKMTGTNPKATTDAGALNYIEQNYTGGGSGGNELVIELPTSLESDFVRDGVIVDNESTGDSLKLYNNIVEVLGNENLLHSTIRFINNGNVKINAIMNCSKYGQEEYLAGVLSYEKITGSGETKYNRLGIVTIYKITNGDYYGYQVKYNNVMSISA